jgi:hypothetical protein
MEAAAVAAAAARGALRCARASRAPLQRRAPLLANRVAMPRQSQQSHRVRRVHTHAGTSVPSMEKSSETKSFQLFLIIFCKPRQVKK